MSFISSLFNSSNPSDIASQELSGQTSTANPNLTNTLNTQLQGTQGAQAATNGQIANLAGQLSNNGGVGNQNSVYNQQQALANQLQAMSQGQGPNPALAQLQQTTGQNVANQAALMAGQRGAGANAGLIARQAAQQGANTQQQAVGQAATQAAQQQIAATQALQNQQGLLGNTASQQIGEQQSSLQNQMAGYNTLANQQLAQAQLSQQGTESQNANNLAAQQSAQGVNNQQTQQGMGVVGGIANAGASLIGLANGGMLQAYAQGGMAQQGGPEVARKENYKGQSKLGQRLHMYAHGGKAKTVDALVSPGEKIIPKEKLGEVLKGKKAPMEAGKTVPGKAKVAGPVNSYANDTVPKKLKEGDIVLPRSVTQSKHPHWAAKKFIETIMAKKSK